MDRMHTSSTRPRSHHGWRVGAAVIALAFSAAALAQGIYPGDLPKDGTKLPGGIEPVVQLRTYYFDAENTGGTPSRAWALGGWVGLRTPWLADFFQAAANYYVSGKLYGPEGEGGTKILTSNQDSIYVLGEAFGAFRFAGQTLTAYRQLIDRPFINPNDSRMIPNTFEAYTLSGAADDVSYIGGYITKEKNRDTESFVWMSNVAGGTGSQEGVAFAGLTWKFGNGGTVRLDEQYAFDVFNTFYADVRYPFAVDDKTRLVLAAQYYPQTSVGDDQIGSFSTWGAGLQAVVNHGPFGVQLNYAQTGTGYSTQSPFGSHPSYNSIQVWDFNSAGEKAWGVRANVDCASLGAPGLTGYVFYVSGTDRQANGTGAPLPDRNETDLRVDYAFPKGTLLEGFTATFRYAWTREDGAAQTGTQLRAILNYAVRF